MGAHHLAHSTSDPLIVSAGLQKSHHLRPLTNICARGVPSLTDRMSDNNESMAVVLTIDSRKISPSRRIKRDLPRQTGTGERLVPENRRSFARILSVRQFAGPDCRTRRLCLDSCVSSREAWLENGSVRAVSAFCSRIKQLVCPPKQVFSRFTTIERIVQPRVTP